MSLFLLCAIIEIGQPYIKCRFCPVILLSGGLFTVGFNGYYMPVLEEVLLIA